MSKKHILVLIFVLYIIGVLSLTFIVRESMSLRDSDNRGMILTPFRELFSMIHDENHIFWFMQIFLNILLFVPLGILLPILFKPFRTFGLTALTGFLSTPVLK